MTEQEQATEFQRRRDIPGVVVRHMNAGRTSDVVISLCGKELGQKTTIYTRNKVSQVSYYLPKL